MASNIRQTYPGLPQIRTVTCKCGKWMDYSHEPASKALPRAGWTKKRGEWWKCPECSGKKD